MRNRSRMDDGASDGKLKNPAAVALGRLGGRAGGAARAAKLTPQQRSEAARKASRGRWGTKPEPPPPPPGDAAQRILRLAAGMFAVQGYANVSMRALAQQAGVGLPTLYGLFGGKAGLYQQAWLHSLEEYTAELRAAVHDRAPGAETVYAFCRTICRINTDPARPRLLRNHRLAPDDPTFQEIGELVFSQQFGLLRGSVALLCGEAEADMKAYAVYALSHGLIQLSPVAQYAGLDLPSARDPDSMALRTLAIVFPDVDWRAMTHSGPSTAAIET